MQTGHGDDIYAYEDIRLNFSSNIYNHFDHSGLYAHLTKSLASVGHYPEPPERRISPMMAKYLGVYENEVLVTSGATEAIYLVAQAFAGAASTIAEPTFAEYGDAVRLHAKMHSSNDKLMWICNPNNPTGKAIERSLMIEKISSNKDTTFVIDASYASFTRVPLLSAAEAIALGNTIMIHSLTKDFSVPGLRLGCITAPASIIQRLRALQMPWSINSLAVEAGVYLLAHANDYHIPLDELLAESVRFANALDTYIDVEPSDTHIRLCRLHRGTAAVLKERLAREHGILIRDASNFSGLTPAHFRIAVQTPAENNCLIEAIKCCI